MLTVRLGRDLLLQLFYPVNKNPLSLNIFLIDDDLDEAELFAEALKTIDTPTTFNSFSLGTEALQSIIEENNVPDCIFLDLNMPLVSGKEVLRRLRATEVAKTLRVIVYSTTISPKDVDDTRDYMVEYLQKPSDFDTLCKKISEILTP